MTETPRMDVLISVPPDEVCWLLAQGFVSELRNDDGTFRLSRPIPEDIKPATGWIEGMFHGPTNHFR
jgi:hypothetical protein